MGTARMSPQRRPTLHFLDEIRAFSPVFLDTEVDMSAVLRHREQALDAGERYSVISYVVVVAGRVLIGHPEANSAVHGRAFPSVARYDAAHCKFTLDKRLHGQRVVVSTVLRDVHEADLRAVQREITRFREGDPERMPEFAATRLLHRLPVPLGRWLFRLGVRPLRRRASAMGTFAVTSLSHRPVDGFASVGGTTITLGLGQVAQRPVVRDGIVTTAPVMRLTLTFDHRVIDGAEAADVLSEIKTELEAFGPAKTPPAGLGTDPAWSRSA